MCFFTCCKAWGSKETGVSPLNKYFIDSSWRTLSLLQNVLIFKIPTPSLGLASKLPLQYSNDQFSNSQPQVAGTDARSMLVLVLSEKQHINMHSSVPLN